MYFKDYYQYYEDFKEDLAVYVVDFKNNKIFDFNDNTNRYTSLKNIWFCLYQHFINKPLRYQEQDFKIQFWTTFINYYPGLYIKQLVYANDQLEQLVDQQKRGTVNLNLPTGTTTSTNFSAETNAGELSSSDKPFDLTQETLFHKSGNQNVTSFKARQTKNEHTHLYMNALAITNSTMNFGLIDFCKQFSYLAKIYYVPNMVASSASDVPVIDVKFDEDTVKKINGKYRVVGIKDE